MPAHTTLDATSNLWAACDAWLHRATEIINDSTAALNALNVFPVSDSDTGSNLRLTLAGVAQAVPHVRPDSLDALVQAAILSAHGNSGAIVAEMFTSVCRTLERSGDHLRTLPAGQVIAELLRTVATAATQAVARPVAGTILTVADEAASHATRAAETSPEDPLAVACGAQAGAREALARTTDQLEVLQRAGVVDAGGQAYVLLLDVLVEVLGGDPAVALPYDGAPAAAAGGAVDDATDTEYEVMYALRGAEPDVLDGLRAELSAAGNSVVIVGDRSVAQVHVHLAVPGAAIEAGMQRGQLSQVRITALPRAAETQTATRTVVALVAGDGLAEAVVDLGGIALSRGVGPETADRLAAVLNQTHGEVVILPNDMENLEIARHVGDEFRRAGRRIAVIPTVAQVQGLAAIAVHEPAADFDTAVVAMSAASGHTRHGAVTMAESPAMTMAGRCEAGDVLGIVEGDFVVIGDDLERVATEVLTRLLASGGELVTLVVGADVAAGLSERLQETITRAHEGVEVQMLTGGQRRYPVLMGVE